MTPSSTVVPFAPGPVSNGLFTRSNHDDYRQLMQQGLNLVQQCLQRQQQPFSGILPQELAADFERVDLERPLGDAARRALLGLGALAGLAVATLIGVAIFRAGVRLNLGAFFTVTGAALVVIAAGLLSYGAHELIEVGLLPAIVAPVYDLSSVLPHTEGIGQFLRAIVGYSATPELSALFLQVSYLVLGLYFYILPVRRASAVRAASGATS